MNTQTTPTATAEDQEKHCTRCRESWPATSEFFPKSGGHFSAWCKACNADARATPEKAARRAQTERDRQARLKATPVTEREQHVMDYLRVFLRMNDQLPPCRTISEAFGWASSNTAFETLQRLEAKGALQRNEIGNLMFADHPATKPADPLPHLRGQIAVLAKLLREAIEVVRNVEAEGCSEGELLKALIERADAAINQVTTEHLTVGIDLASGKDMHFVELFPVGVPS
jgi:hypothetical protein